MEYNSVAEKIMMDFATRTCLRGKDCKPIRYLWTDAFAVCNYLELYYKSGEPEYRDLALKLVDQVHHILGRHRGDDERSGWISGLGEKEGEAHPTIGGLRIGKKQNERKRDEPQDERLEWEQDGQYYHYLTKWMHALDLVSDATGDLKYRRWALELAHIAYERFTYTTPANSQRMYWKMSIDLSYPLVHSMGQHDALDGYVTYQELHHKACRSSRLPKALYLEDAIAGLLQMSHAVNQESDDPLGIGGMLSDAALLAQLIVENKETQSSILLSSLLRKAYKGITRLLHTDTMRYPAAYRLAFRELGLSIGLHGVSQMQRLVSRHAGSFEEPIELQKRLKSLQAYLPLCRYIENFWLNPNSQKSPTWSEHLDINTVMLATSLEPDGYLRLSL